MRLFFVSHTFSVNAQVLGPSFDSCLNLFVIYYTKFNSSWHAVLCVCEVYYETIFRVVRKRYFGSNPKLVLEMIFDWRI